jgi:DNA (cytosine-5)-methyltransferase 1
VIWSRDQQCRPLLLLAIFLKPIRHCADEIKTDERMAREFQVVDLFAGPGGLAEGFSACRRNDGSRPFRIAMSVEKEASAHSTLRLRAFLRQFENGYPAEYYRALNASQDQPDWNGLFPNEWQAAEREALHLEMGLPDANATIASRIDAIRKSAGGRTVLIGGPPCQAYSLVGRARNRGTAGYRAEKDGRHFLYKEYISVLERLLPAVFVMENVKGLISSSVEGRFVLERIIEDLQSAGGRNNYTLLSVAPAQDGFLELGAIDTPSDFIIRAEQFGIPQARHRIIIVGVRKDLLPGGGVLPVPRLKPVTKSSAARHVLDGLPALRSGLSGEPDGAVAWRKRVAMAIKAVIDATSGAGNAAGSVTKRARTIQKVFASVTRDFERRGYDRPTVAPDCPQFLAEWILDRRLKAAPNHDTRGHMASDLARYFFCATFAEVNGRSPKAAEFPDELAPSHANWTSGKFADRFRAQLRDAPSTTITSHISKDGHYFIHPDPLQCRSLTVREAARLQTFPDNYLFLGNRTQQYVQVGNAVPPLLAKQIGDVVLDLLEADHSARPRKKGKLSTVAAE